ncbi:DNA-binding transcriptional LysR family regulator [Litoreibacter halocynthiae]|uniref:DNA-binding transcriptional LysR family regulator n=1 Tax=Litoreibacter halocynthiae TaxID=1242689 RepID=A0A4R7LMW1_9RHOB|nr:LysR substrate-binding domain-containing protein [Litoreibacter halocynthiae]TDT76759.1 DNA-binding transcriptional LysR family regulator [Litoreibacter halocynthiae]
MSITLLRTLIAVADTGSFVAASDQVHVSQAAVGQQMRRLEDVLGAALFDRQAKPPSLTALALSLIPKARAVVAAYDALLADAGSESTLVGTLTLGAVPSSLHGLVPMALKRLMQSTPQLQVRVVPGLSSDLVEMVDRGAVDAVITSALDVPSSSLRTYHIAHEPLVLIIAPDGPKGTPEELLRSLPYIRHARRSAAGKIAEDWLVRNRINVQSSMELESLETVASVVAHGLGVSVVPHICVPDPVFAGLRRVSLEAPGRNLCLLTRADCPKAPLIERLVQEILEAVRICKVSLNQN